MRQHNERFTLYKNVIRMKQCNFHATNNQHNEKDHNGVKAVVVGKCFMKPNNRLIFDLPCGDVI